MHELRRNIDTGTLYGVLTLIYPLPQGDRREGMARAIREQTIHLEGATALAYSACQQEQSHQLLEVSVDSWPYTGIATTTRCSPLQVGMDFTLYVHPRTHTFTSYNSPNTDSARRRQPSLPMLKHT